MLQKKVLWANTISVLVIAVLALTLGLSWSAKSAAAELCVNDTAGANDEATQKDLTKLCVDEAGLPTSVAVKWNWDDLGTSGGGQSMDACALFDSDNDGNINYAACVTTQDDPATLDELTLYSCGDAKSDRCTTPNPAIAGPYSSSCSVTQTATDPFPSGNNSPTDTTATCTITLADFGATGLVLVDVCSYPSREPNSDPSDCVVQQDNSGKLEVVKQLIPATDSGVFDLQVDGVTRANDVGNNGTTGEVVVGEGSHNVGELAGGPGTTLTNYATSITCRDQNGSGSIVATTANGTSVSVNVPDDSDIVCVVTNSRNPTLTVTKVVVNDNGGTKQITDFPLFVDSNPVVSGQTNTFGLGAHTVSETVDATYAATISGDCASNGSVTLVPGDVKNCTITNNDRAPSLTLVKNVVNDNGGTAVATNWTLTATGPTPISGPGGVSSGATFSQGSYTLTESTGPSGYTPSAWVCTGNGTQNASTISLSLGQNATCTITNNDQPGTLIVRKVVVNDNGGTAVAQNFSFTIDGGIATAFEADAQNNVTINAGPHTVVEPAVIGYATTYNNCVGVVVPNGGTATCTITNNDISPQLTVIKHVINDNGGESVAGDFTMTVVATNPSQTTFAGSETGTVVTLNAGSYMVDEQNPVGYTKTIGANCSGTIAIGETKSCTITNNDQARIALTRTQGFWQTHLSYTTSVFNSMTASERLICGGRTIDSVSELMGGFWSSISKTTTGAKRSKLDQARMQLAQQLLAAMLNKEAFNAPDGGAIAAGKAAYCTTNINNILAAAAALDAYNNSGDTTPLATPTGSASPYSAQTAANKTLWNTLP